MRGSRVYAGFLCAMILALFVLPAAPAAAQEPFRLPAPVTDQAGALSASQEGEVRAAVDRLRMEGGVQLYIAYVDTFSGVPSEQWTEQTWDRSDLRDNNALIAIATQDRSYSYVPGQEFPLSDEQLHGIAVRDIEPALAKGDWAGAGVAAATAYTQAIGGGGGSIWPWLLLGVGIAVVAFVIYRMVAGRKPAEAHAGEPGGLAGMPTEELASKANALLVATDDAVKSSEQELGFAAAQFGEGAVGTFRTTLEKAKTELSNAFALRQKLDDGNLDEPAQRQIYAQIIQSCTHANDGLDKEAQAFAELRNLESTVQDVLPQLETRATELKQQIPNGKAQLGALASAYSSKALEPVATNPDQAVERIAFAEHTLAQAKQDLAADNKGTAVVGVRAAEEALGQAEKLLGSIAKLETDLKDAGSKVDALRREITEELAEARTLQGYDLGSTIPRVESVLAQTQGSTDDPLNTLRLLEQTDEELDRVLGDARSEQDRAQKAAQLLEQTMLSARSEITAARDFIDTRRGAVGGDARTRLAEAERYYDQALRASTSDPAGALESARQADALARDAGERARSDVAGWQAPSMSGGFPGLGGGGGGGGGGGMGAMTGAMLGGLLGNILGGGGGGGGGFTLGGGGFGGATTSGQSARRRRGGGGRF